MRLTGLTGGIASGKSSVSQMLASLGAEILDADLLAREVVAPGSDGLAAVVDAFGEEVLEGSGALDRKRLGEVVFANPAQRKVLEAITHPRIFQRFLASVDDARKRDVAVLVYDAPLLIERKLHLMMDAVIVVWVPTTLQIERLLRRDGISHEAALQRLAAQMPLDDKRAHATYVVDNSGSFDLTREQVERIWKSLLLTSS
jgi:dephospho-CoA kinase